jgi:uncharacterized membrane protein HdeD (DUF308 family)
MSEFADAAKTGSKTMTIFGAIAIILGIFAMLAPGLTGLSIAMVVGVLVVIGGIVRMLWAFQSGSLGKGLLMFAIGALTLLCGIALVANPLFAAGFLTVFLAVYFVIDGISEIAAGFQTRPAPGSGWMIFGGIVSILFGIMMWQQYPLAGAWAIGILLGIKLFFVGLMMITGGSAVRSLAKE